MKRDLPAIIYTMAIATTVLVIEICIIVTIYFLGGCTPVSPYHPNSSYYKDHPSYRQPRLAYNPSTDHGSAQ